MSGGDDLDGLRGLCPVPFLAESKFPSTGGYILGRICASVPGVADGESCCLQCNSVYWLYPDNFYDLTRIPGFIAIASALLCIYILLSFIVLPKKCTNRHYLNTGLTISVLILELGFAVPVLVRPQQCYNQITPNGIQSSMTCAWTGAFVIFGGVAVNSWILVRAVNMHLLICWNITPGNKFFYAAQVFAWGLSIVLLATCLSITGVSFRFGDYCHVNHNLAMGTYWGPLLTFAGLSALIQLSTFAYCLHVYLTRAWADSDRTNTRNSKSSSAGSARAKSARAVYRRVRQVIGIQWRGLCIALIGVIDVVYFALVFILLDNKSSAAIHNLPEALPWVGCLIAANGDKDECLTEAARVSVNEATLIATLILLSIVGFQVALLIGSRGMITGWKDVFVRRPPESKFLPLHDAATSPSHSYKMLKLGTNVQTTPSTIFAPSPEVYSSSMPSHAGMEPPFALSSPRSTTRLIDRTNATTPTTADDGEYFLRKGDGRDGAKSREREEAKANVERAYHSPRMSFSSPRSPVAAAAATTTTVSAFSPTPRSSAITPVATAQQQQRHQSGWDVENIRPSGIGIGIGADADTDTGAGIGREGGSGALGTIHENASGLGLHSVIRESSVYEYHRDWS